MQWSKLKARVESFICEELQSRVSLFNTWYKNGGSPARGRGAVLLDKVIIFEADTDKWLRNRDYIGIIERKEFISLLEEYLELSIEEALNSKHVLIKGLAVIDRRVGKRRLMELDFTELDNEFLFKLYKARCEVEGIDKA
jgi:hypothetical protein